MDEKWEGPAYEYGVTWGPRSFWRRTMDKLRGMRVAMAFSREAKKQAKRAAYRKER